MGIVYGVVYGDFFCCSVYVRKLVMTTKNCEQLHHEIEINLRAATIP